MHKTQPIILLAPLGLLLLLLLRGYPAFAQDAHLLDSLGRELKLAKHDSSRVKLLNKIGTEHFYSNLDSAQFWWEKTLELANQLAEEEEIHVRNAGLYAGLGARNNLAVIFQYRGIYPEALANYHECIRISNDLGNRLGKMRALNNIGMIKEVQKDFDDALIYYGSSILISREAGDEQSMSTSLNNVGTVLHKMKKNRDALLAFRLSLHYSRKLKEPRQEVDNLINIGSLWIDGKQADSAMTCFSRAEALAYQYEYETALTSVWLGIADARLISAQPQLALAASLRALRMADSLDFTEEIVRSHKSLAEIYENMGDYASANLHLHQYQQLNDSLFTVDKTLEFGQLEASFDYEKREYEKSIREKTEKEELRKKYFRQYLEAFASLCLFAMLMLVALIFVKNQKVRFFVVFTALIFFFEFILVILDNSIDKWTGGLPYPKLMVNIALALVFTPVQNLLEKAVLRWKVRRTNL